MVIKLDMEPYDKLECRFIQNFLQILVFREMDKLDHEMY